MVSTSTVPVAVTLTSPSTASVAVAPASVYTAPNTCVTVAEPVKVMTGDTLSNAIVLEGAIKVYPDAEEVAL